ncbi:DUF2892 domain-containing protein [Phreatobacter aquaticus]|uniref:DUF2892 domain-containing protein n=1 Tax=Phreatobacter aquaticus TaxID=2570229 RepID=A0A4D7QKA8_9HYPH|nr:DUF2892 domain-containing protein [Phreatobacter aquaticus]QCK84752.1 DUF2892 domain-containing protein [Phreatobacter aquaticus]
MANVGSTDRIIRIVVGIILIAVALVPALAALLAGLGKWIWVLPVVGAVMIATAFMRFCPAYTLLGINTCGTK